MSKFTVKIKLQNLEIQVEGSREDVPRIARRVGDQFGSLVNPALLAEVNPEHTGAATDPNGNASETKSRGKRKSGSSSSKSPADELTLSVDSSRYGSPSQDWTTTQKSIWFLYVVGQTTSTKEMTAYSIAKNFNAHFKSAGAINAGNVSKGLEKERLKGKDATVGANTGGGAAKYFLTDAGNSFANRLAHGEAVASE